MPSSPTNAHAMVVENSFSGKRREVRFVRGQELFHEVVTTGYSSSAAGAGCHIIVVYSGYRSQPMFPYPVPTPHCAGASMLGRGSGVVIAAVVWEML